MAAHGDRGSYCGDTVRVIAVILFFNSVLRGMRAPGRWAATHLLFNYDFGFTKRALLGSAVAALHIPTLYHYSFFFWFSLVFFAADMMFLLALLRNALSSGDNLSRIVALLFASSLGIVFLAHTIGYFEHITLLVTLVTLRTRGFYARALLVLVLFSTSLLIHETGFLLFFPVILLRFALDLTTLNTPRRLVVLCILGLLLSAMTFWIGRAHLDNATVEAMRTALQSTADYHLRQDAFLVLTRALDDNVRMTFDIWLNPEFRRYFGFSLLVTLPTALYLLRASLIRISRNPHGIVIGWLAVIASLAPLSLHFLGWDSARWDTLTITTSFLVFTTISLSSLNDGRTDQPHFLPLVPVMLIALNLASGIALFDNYSVQLFPYEGHLADVVDIISGRAPFPPRPETCLPAEPNCP